MQPNLKRSREVTAAAKAIAAMGHPLQFYVENRCYSIRDRQAIIEIGIPATIKAIDDQVTALRKLLDIGHSFARFMMENPIAPVIQPHDFPMDSLEHAVIVYVMDPNASCEDDADDEDGAGERERIRKTAQAAEAVLGQVPPLTGHLGHVFAHIMNDGWGPLTRSTAWTLLAHTEREIATLLEIRRMLAPPDR